MRKGSCATQGEKAAIIKELREKGYQLKLLLKAVSLSRSTYYYEISCTSFDDKKNQDIMNEINNIFNENKKRYGVRRIHKELLNRGHSINHKKVQRLMHKMGLSGKQPKEKYHSYKGEVEKLQTTLSIEILAQQHRWKNGQRMYHSLICLGVNVTFLLY